MRGGAKMRAPGKKLVIYLALLALGVVLAVYGFDAEQKIGEDWQSTGMAVAGLILIPICAVQAVFALLHTIGQMRLLLGHNALARWHVSASAWWQAEALDPQWLAQSKLPNDLTVTRSLIDRGIDVIVGTKSLLVGDSYYPLRQWAIPQLHGLRLVEDSDPGCLEFHILYPRRYGPGVRLAVRVPFTREVRPEAVRAYEYFAPRYVPKVAPALRRPRRTIAVSLVMSAIAAGAAAWGFGENYAGRTSDVAPLIAAVVGSIVAPVGLIFALATFLLARKHLRSA
jgi:hypothetical protein